MSLKYNTFSIVSDVTDAILAYESDTFSANSKCLDRGNARRMAYLLIKYKILDEIGNLIDGAYLTSILDEVENDYSKGVY